MQETIKRHEETIANQVTKHITEIDALKQQHKREIKEVREEIKGSMEEEKRVH